jgi:hypothetical protein
MEELKKNPADSRQPSRKTLKAEENGGDRAWKRQE